MIIVASMDTSFKLSLCGEENTNRLSMFRSKSPETCKIQNAFHHIYRIIPGSYLVICGIKSESQAWGGVQGEGVPGEP